MANICFISYNSNFAKVYDQLLFNIGVYNNIKVGFKKYSYLVRKIQNTYKKEDVV